MSSYISSSEATFESQDADAADFLLSNSKYHDCLLVVGNPDTDEVETISAESIHLIAHSPVLRKMLGHSRAKDPSEPRILVTDVSPSTFRLMLRFIYGGKLSQMTAIEAAGLALCADKFKIPRLVRKALKRLDPTSAEDVFPALICVSYIEFPDLELKVRNIVQKETDKIVGNFDFLELDEDCVIFILKQNILNISELELWKCVTRWAEYQIKINPHKTVRDCLMKIFGYLRFLSLTLEDILEHVLPTKILSPEEFMDLTLALTKKQALQSPSLCKIQERRNLYKEEAIAIPVFGGAEGKTKDEEGALKDKPGTGTFNKSCIFKISDYFDHKDKIYDYRSSFSIKPSEFIEIVSFTFHGIEKRRQSLSCVLCGRWGDQKLNVFAHSYKFICYITVTKTIKGTVVSEKIIRVANHAAFGGNLIVCMEWESGQPLVLNPNETCTFTLEFTVPHRVYNLSNSIVPDGLVDVDTPLKMDNISFTHERSSVTEINYRKGPMLFS